MNAKLITAALGVLLLGSGTAAMAHDWGDRDDYGWRRHYWRDHEWREHEWRRHHHPHWRHEYYRYEPYWEPYWERRYVPVPDWRYRSSYPYGYDQDGVSIILKGRIN